MKPVTTVLETVRVKHVLRVPSPKQEPVVVQPVTPPVNTGTVQVVSIVRPTPIQQREPPVVRRVLRAVSLRPEPLAVPLVTPPVNTGTVLHV